MNDNQHEISFHYETPFYYLFLSYEPSCLVHIVNYDLRTVLGIGLNDPFICFVGDQYINLRNISGKEG